MINSETWTASNKCHASSNRCLTSSNKKAIRINLISFLLLLPGSSKKQPSPESFHVIVSTPCTPTSMLSGQARYQRPSEKTAIQVGTCQETNQQHWAGGIRGIQEIFSSLTWWLFFFEEPGEIFFGNVDRRHAISIVNTTCDNLRGHLSTSFSRYLLLPCLEPAIPYIAAMQLTVNSQSTHSQHDSQHEHFSWEFSSKTRVAWGNFRISNLRLELGLQLSKMRFDWEFSGKVLVLTVVLTVCWLSCWLCVDCVLTVSCMAGARNQRPEATKSCTCHEISHYGLQSTAPATWSAVHQNS